MVVIFGAGLGQRKQGRSSRSAAGSEGRRESGGNPRAPESDAPLLGWRQRQSGRNIRHAADHQSTVETPCEIDPLLVLMALVAHVRVLLIGLIVVDPKNAARDAAQRDQAAGFRREITRARVPQRQVSLKSMQ